MLHLRQILGPQINHINDTYILSKLSAHKFKGDMKEKMSFFFPKDIFFPLPFPFFMDTVKPIPLFSLTFNFSYKQSVQG